MFVLVVVRRVFGGVGRCSCLGLLERSCLCRGHGCRVASCLRRVLRMMFGGTIRALCCSALSAGVHAQTLSSFSLGALASPTRYGHCLQSMSPSRREKCSVETTLKGSKQAQPRSTSFQICLSAPRMWSTPHLLESEPALSWSTAPPVGPNSPRFGPTPPQVSSKPPRNRGLPPPSPLVLLPFACQGVRCRGIGRGHYTNPTSYIPIRPDLLASSVSSGPAGSLRAARPARCPHWGSRTSCVALQRRGARPVAQNMGARRRVEWQSPLPRASDVEDLSVQPSWPALATHGARTEDARASSRNGAALSLCMCARAVMWWR